MLRLLAACLVGVLGVPPCAGAGGPPAAAARPVLVAESFKHYVDEFNGMSDEAVVNHVPNAAAWDWLKQNIPLFESPDTDFERTYYYRWWAFRKHLKKTPDGFVFTEFLTPQRHQLRPGASRQRRPLAARVPLSGRLPAILASLGRRGRPPARLPQVQRLDFGRGLREMAGQP